MSGNCQFTFIVAVSIGFLLLAIMTAWSFRKVKGRLVVKLILSFLVIWYSAALYFSLPMILGYPVPLKSQLDLPDKAYILSYTLREPTKETPGTIYVWLYEGKDQDRAWSPMRPFIFPGRKPPRVYSFPFTKGAAKRLYMAARLAGRQGGRVVTRKKKGDKKKGTLGEDTTPSKMMFRVINPLEIMKKDGELVKTR